MPLVGCGIAPTKQTKVPIIQSQVQVQVCTSSFLQRVVFASPSSARRFSQDSLLDLVFTNDTDIFHSSVDVLPPISTSDHLPVVVHYCPAKDNLSQYNPYPSIKYIKWNFSQKHNNMAEAFIFENWQHVFEPSLNINETWDRWKEQFFKEVKSFIGHKIKNDNHEKTTSTKVSQVV